MQKTHYDVILLAEFKNYNNIITYIIIFKYTQTEDMFFYKSSEAIVFVKKVFY